MTPGEAITSALAAAPGVASVTVDPQLANWVTTGYVLTREGDDRTYLLQRVETHYEWQALPID